MILIIMGVSGAGKTTIAERLAERLGCDFLEGDAFHPPSNVAKMRTGTPLEDADRWPWLATIAKAIDQRLLDNQTAIITCSALKRSYRDILRADSLRTRLIFLQGDHATLQAHVDARDHDFMPPSLLKSQLATLEPPTPDEMPICVNIDQPIEKCIDQIVQAIS